MDKEKFVDESWKDSVEGEKLGKDIESGSQESAEEQEQSLEVNFLNYLTSMAFQAMIFLGEIPNPMADNKVDVNLKQAKFLIDTLLMLREKTKGNLSKEEEELLNVSLYELQLKFVEKSKSPLQQ